MASFTDNSKRTWLVHLDGPTIEEVRAKFTIPRQTKNKEGSIVATADVPLDLAADDSEAYAALAADPCKLVNVLAFLCREQFSQHQCDAISFGRALVGDAIDAATQALRQAMLDFFPQRKRALVGAVFAQDEATQEEAVQAAIAKISDPNLRSRIVQKFQDSFDADLERLLTPSTSATDSPAPSESAPTD